MLLRRFVLVLPVLAACATVRPVAAPVNFIPQRNPRIVWVTAQSGEVIPVMRPSIQGDTLLGQWQGTSERVRLPLPQIQMISARQPDRTRTALLVAGATALAGFIVWRAIEGGNGPGICFYEPGPGTFCR